MNAKTFNELTVEFIWTELPSRRVEVLQAVYGGVMDYWKDTDYSNLPWGVKERLEVFIEILENKRVKNGL